MPVANHVHAFKCRRHHPTRVNDYQDVLTVWNIVIMDRRFFRVEVTAARILCWFTECITVAAWRWVCIMQREAGSKKYDIRYEFMTVFILLWHSSVPTTWCYNYQQKAHLSHNILFNPKIDICKPSIFIGVQVSYKTSWSCKVLVKCEIYTSLIMCLDKPLLN